MYNALTDRQTDRQTCLRFCNRFFSGYPKNDSDRLKSRSCRFFVLM